MQFLWSAMLLLGLAALCVTQGGDAAVASMTEGACEAVLLCFELAGAYLLFMGMLGVAKRAGLMESLTRRLARVTAYLFPHDAHAGGAIAAAFAANMLGLGNAATPLGLEAMRRLDEQNPSPGTATDGMCTFLVINASALQLLPTGLIALRQAAGSASPASIVLPSLLASVAATAAAVVLCKTLSN